MPLHPGTSPAVFSRNVSEMMRSGRPQAQALAAAYREKRQSRAPGGPVMPPMGGPGAFPGPQAGLGTLANQVAPMGASSPSMGMPRPPAGLPAQGGLGSLSAPPAAMGGAPPLGMGMPGIRPPGMAAGGNPIASTPYFAKAEARSMGHVGPVIGSTLGRGDSKSITVPGGSYVLPAAHVSALGQGNTLAGHSLINQMFTTGPFGTALSKGHGGSGPPKAPRAGGFAAGGSPKKGAAVPIMISDGEHVLSPEQVEAVDRYFGGPGDVDRGHKILDAWVMHERQKHIKTLKKLPGPAKD